LPRSPAATHTIQNGPNRSPSRPEPAGSRCTPRYPTASPAARSQSCWNDSPSPQSTSIRLEAYGVTPREREIAILLAQGLTNPEIARRLVLSPYTVQDHTKSLFEKTGVSSRQELVARVFLDEYLPQLAQRTPLTSTGSFIQHPDQVEQPPAEQAA
jgi:DNA-binding CsgD family transcriptional regulator